MKAEIRNHALRLGFDACQFAAARAPGSAGHFDRWLGDQCHGEMGYMERNSAKRRNPDLVLPGAKTVITLLASYGDSGQPQLEPQSSNPDSTVRGLIARYARFSDYHVTLGEKLRLLTDAICQMGGPGTRSLWYVDTGPILERDFAQTSGAGFIGKHTNLINRRLGNWVFLSEILTSLELDPDEPERNYCGACTRCISACPTRAITAPFQLDARRCISYLTIELKGPIPIEFRPAIGNRIYGCDDCLEACPWNRFAREGNIMREQSRKDLAAPDLIELLSLDEHSFKLKFRGTPILRSKRRGLLRNVCVALGNIGNESALPALSRASLDPEPLIAEHALWAIHQIKDRMRSV